MIDDLILNDKEREFVRREFRALINDAPSVHDGFRLKRWMTGPNKGKVKLSTAVQGLLDRGLITFEDVGLWPTAKFTENGLRALKLMAADRRAFDPALYQRLIDEVAQVPDFWPVDHASVPE